MAQPASSPNDLQTMIDAQVIARGVRTPAVLSALDATPRDWFVSEELKSHAYADRPLCIGEGQTISQPFIVALMTDLLQVRPTDRVLEIGTGSGYQTAILARLTPHVYTVERIESLSRQARARLVEHGFASVQFRVGDGTLGWPEEAPFDRILVTAGGPVIPKPLYEQLADGGRMVLPVGGEAEQTLRVVERHGDEFIEQPGIPVRFVRLIGVHGFEGS